MLIDFSFSNFRSFRDEQSFSMTRDERFIESDEPKQSSITAVYGANASGKSNFLKALRAMSDMVANSYSRGDANSSIPREPFLLRENPFIHSSSFFLEFIANDGLKYRYWFRYDNKQILEEELTFFKDMGGRFSTHSSLLFSRSLSDGVKFGTSFKGPRAQVRKTIELRPNALLLSAAAAAGIESIQPAFSFFQNGIAYYEANAFEQEQPILLEEFKKETPKSKHLSTLIRYADFGISDVKGVPVDVPPEIWAQIKEHMHEQFGMDEGKMEETFNVKNASQLQFTHTGESSSASFNLEDESKGTVAALSFFSVFFRQLSRKTVTLIDEIDTSLHPTLVAELVALYADQETNPHGSQLIFTTHDVSLINQSGLANRLLQPDQIWLVEKNEDGASELFPVTDMGIRKGENIGKNYLNGIYGATPKPDFHTVFAQIMNGADA